MKLVKETRYTKNLNQCKAVTKSGKRCKRKKHQDDLCKQHFALQESFEKELAQYPGGILEEVPPAPSSLEGTWRDRWVQVCESLHSYNQLRGIYLKEIYHLIQLEMLLDDIMRGVQNRPLDDYLNQYITETGQPGNNINGLWVLKRDTEKELADIRRRLFLTPDGVPKLIKNQDIILKVLQKNTPIRKVKSWT